MKVLTKPKKMQPSTNGHAKTKKTRAAVILLSKPMERVAAVCVELQALQRRLSITVKSRIMQANRLQAIVAGTLGYTSSMAEKQRQKKMVEASKIIGLIFQGKKDDHPLADIVQATMVGITQFVKLEDNLRTKMEVLVKQLPVTKWTERKEQTGFGLFTLAKIIGETGDLSKYTNPGKVWRRMGCAPKEFNGVTQMGEAWRKRLNKCEKLPSEEWEEFGYSPRRRSIAYLVGEGLMKQNYKKDAKTKKVVWMGPYRARYESAKTIMKKAHPDYSDMHCHKHGMLLATKLLLKNLWVEWNGHPKEIKTW